MTGSAAVLAEATHAAAELLRTIVAAFAARDEARTTRAPAAAGRLEGGIVVLAGVVSAFAAVRSLDGSVDRALLGIVVLLACALLARLVAARVAAVAEATRSSALAADARSLRSSQTTAVVAAAALALVLLVHHELPDAVGGLVISAVVVRIGVELVQAALPGNQPVGPRELAEITAALASGPPEVVGYGRIAARTAAGVRRIDIDVTVRADVDGRRMAEVAEEVRTDVSRRIPGRRVVVHLRKPVRPSRKATARNRPRGQ